MRPGGCAELVSMGLPVSLALPIWSQWPPIALQTSVVSTVLFQVMKADGMCLGWPVAICLARRRSGMERSVAVLLLQ